MKKGIENKKYKLTKVGKVVFTIIQIIISLIIYMILGKLGVYSDKYGDLLFIAWFTFGFGNLFIGSIIWN